MRRVAALMIFVAGCAWESPDAWSTSVSLPWPHTRFDSSALPQAMFHVAMRMDQLPPGTGRVFRGVGVGLRATWSSPAGGDGGVSGDLGLDGGAGCGADPAPIDVWAAPSLAGCDYWWGPSASTLVAKPGTCSGTGAGGGYGYSQGAPASLLLILCMSAQRGINGEVDVDGEMNVSAQGDVAGTPGTISASVY